MLINNIKSHSIQILKKTFESVSGFSLDRKHISSENMNSFYVLSLLYTVFLSLAMITSYRFFSFFNIATATTGVFFICICFVINNVITENYTYIYAKRLTFFALLTIGIGFALLQLTNILPSPEGKEVFENSYNVVMKNEFTGIWFYNTIAALIGFNSTAVTLFFLKKKKINLILRILLADILGEFLFTFLVILLIMLPVGQPLETILSIAIISFISKLIFSLICSTMIVPLSQKIIPIFDGKKYEPAYLE